MWALALFTHPESEFLFYKPEQRKKAIVNVLKVDLRYLNNTQLLNKFIKSTMTYPEQRLIFWRTELESMDFHLQKYNPETLEELKEKAGVLSTYTRLWDAYRKAELEFQKQEKDQIHGGTEESPNESGKI